MIIQLRIKNGAPGTVFFYDILFTISMLIFGVLYLTLILLDLNSSNILK